MSEWPRNATWDELIFLAWFWQARSATAENYRRYEDAVGEIYRRLPRVTDYGRVMVERTYIPAPLGSLPDWQPSGIDDPPETTWLVRALSNDGAYPPNPIQTEDGLLAADHEIAWSAVYWPGSDPDERAPISWYRPEEVVFFGAYALAEAHPRTNGRPGIYTLGGAGFLHLPEEATHGDLYDRSREFAMKLRAEYDPISIPDREPKPQLLEKDYQQEFGPLTAVIAAEESHVLLRGLSKMLTAREMFRLPHLLEEMALAAIISREAALELLRRKMSMSEGKRTKKEDVLSRIRAEFPSGEPFTEVLCSDWVNRVIMTHPVSDFGEYWSPPVEAEECFDTLTTLTYLYRYLLLDEIWIPAEYD